MGQGLPHSHGMLAGPGDGTWAAPHNGDRVCPRRWDRGCPMATGRWLPDTTGTGFPHSTPTLSPHRPQPAPWQGRRAPGPCLPHGPGPPRWGRGAEGQPPGTAACPACTLGRVAAGDCPDVPALQAGLGLGEGTLQSTAEVGAEAGGRGGWGHPGVPSCPLPHSSHTCQWLLPEVGALARLTPGLGARTPVPGVVSILSHGHGQGDSTGTCPGSQPGLSPSSRMSPEMSLTPG